MVRRLIRKLLVDPNSVPSVNCPTPRIRLLAFSHGYMAWCHCALHNWNLIYSLSIALFTPNERRLTTAQWHWQDDYVICRVIMNHPKGQSLQGYNAYYFSLINAHYFANFSICSYDAFIKFTPFCKQKFSKFCGLCSIRCLKIIK